MDNRKGNNISWKIRHTCTVYLIESFSKPWSWLKLTLVWPFTSATHTYLSVYLQEQNGRHMGATRASPVPCQFCLGHRGKCWLHIGECTKSLADAKIRFRLPCPHFAEAPSCFRQYSDLKLRHENCLVVLILSNSRFHMHIEERSSLYFWVGGQGVSRPGLYISLYGADIRRERGLACWLPSE